MESSAPPPSRLDTLFERIVVGILLFLAATSLAVRLLLLVK
jgi:hypothetical protein